MKVGRNLPAIRRALAAAGKLGRAVYVERATMARDADDAARRQGRRPRALLLAGAGAGLGGAAVSGRLDVVGLGPGGPEQLTGEARAALAAASRPLRLRALSRAADARAGPGGACLRQPRGAGAGAGGAGARGRRAAGRGGVGRRSRGLRDGGGGLRGDRGGARGLAAARGRGGAGGDRDAGGGGALRGAARARLLRALAVGQPEALGDGRGAAAGRGGGGLRDRALQPGQPGAAVAARAGVRGAARGAAAGDRGGLRPRRRARRRADRGGAARRGRRAAWPTWRPASSSARRRRGWSARGALPPLVYTPRFAARAAR